MWQITATEFIQKFGFVRRQMLARSQVEAEQHMFRGRTQSADAKTNAKVMHQVSGAIPKKVAYDVVS